MALVFFPPWVAGDLFYQYRAVGGPDEHLYEPLDGRPPAYPPSMRPILKSAGRVRNGLVGSRTGWNQFLEMMPAKRWTMNTHGFADVRYLNMESEWVGRHAQGTGHLRRTVREDPCGAGIHNQTGVPNTCAVAPMAIAGFFAT